jgi:tetratricopeptide (TPR) repeat protein/F0F1-type ATP synthase assembly protein I
MSETPVQASVSPLPAVDTSPSARFYSLRDLVAGAIAFALTFAGYMWTLAPSVTLEDSGEFLTASYHLGVPHPPGYPVWTILSWIWYHIIPFGNIAWRVNMMSAFFGALACGLATLLVSKSGHVMCAKVGFLHADVNKRLVDLIVMASSICAGLLLAFCPVMWSQSVIAEVYGLNAFCLMATLVVLYRWSFETEKVWRLYLAAFIWGIGLTVHQTLVLLTVAFPTFVWLADRKLGRNVLVPILVVVFLGLVYELGSTWTTIGELDRARAATPGAPSPWETYTFPLIVFLACAAGAGYWLFQLLRGGKLTGVVLTALGVVALGGIFGGLVLKFLEEHENATWVIVAGVLSAAGWAAWAYSIRERNVEDLRQARQALMVYIAVVLGLSFYGYLFLSSSTNPPMNWGHCSQWEGFKHHFTRGQYEKVHLDRTFLQFWGQLNMFFDDLQGQFNIVYALLALLALFFFRDLGDSDRNWLKFLLTGFIFLGIGFVFLSNPTFEKQKQFTDRVFFLPCHCIYALWIGYGLMLGFGYLLTEKRQFQAAAIPLALAVLAMPTWSVLRNWKDQEEHGHDFGYRFGYLMFKPGGGYPEMERDAVLYGGTDPGRFVPTYMIFVESFAPPSAKSHIAKCPDSGTFDRRDVYIITQNALADSTYMAYIRDHYDYSRPRADDPSTLANRSPIYRWLYRAAWNTLGRSTVYPKEPIWIPSEKDAQAAFGKYVDELRNRAPMPGEDVKVEGGRVSVQGVAGVMAINGILTKDIFDRNKDKHAFYVEESYQIPWMYPYLEPYGIILKINKEPLPGITPEMVKRDSDYWNALYEDLKNDPKFHRDDVAQKTFSKLRSAIGGVYAYRRMIKEAEYAFRQAIGLCPDSPEANFRLAQLYVELGRFDESIAVLEAYQKRDEYNVKIRDAINQIKEMKRSLEEISQLEEQLRAHPGDLQIVMQLARAYAIRQRVDLLDALVNQLSSHPDLPPNEFLQLVNLYLQLNRTDRVLTLLQVFVQRFPQNPAGWYNLAIIQSLRSACNEAVTALERALAVDTPQQQIRALAQDDPKLNNCRRDPRFQRLLGSSGTAGTTSGLPFNISR